VVHVNKNSQTIKKNRMKKLLSLCCGALLFFGCQQSVDLEKEKQAVMNTDIEFSNVSEKSGMIESFLTYCATDAVLLRANSMPIEGKDAIKNSLAKRSDKGFTLTWKPTFCSVAKSGELAYTYGLYKLSTHDSIGNPIEGKGTYLTVWRKDAEGKWKWVADTGNEGLGN